MSFLWNLYVIKFWGTLGCIWLMVHPGRIKRIDGPTIRPTTQILLTRPTTQMMLAWPIRKNYEKKEKQKGKKKTEEKRLALNFTAIEIDRASVSHSSRNRTGLLRSPPHFIFLNSSSRYWSWICRIVKVKTENRMLQLRNCVRNLYSTKVLYS